MAHSGSPPLSRSRFAYQPGLDGLRALAVIAVVLYHGDVAAMPGGFLGVEVFFVVSGYLITALLLAEHEQRGGIGLTSFWLRRARRLLPALFALLIAVLVYAALFLQEEIGSLREEALWATTYVSNWFLIVREEPYFEVFGRPPILLHLWSLAIEEQFYLVWPPLLALLLPRWRRRWIVAAIVLGAVASSVLMALLYVPFEDPSRVYYGTDTRGAGLLIGAALALCWRPLAFEGARARMRGWTVDLIAGGALLALFYFATRVSEYDPQLYRGGFAVLALVTAVLIAATVHPSSSVSRVLGLWPLRWVGLQSYSIYLWHWPVFVLLPHGTWTLTGSALLAVQLAIILLLSVASYRMVEQPLRHGAIGRLWAWLRRPARGWRQLAPRGGIVAGVAIAAVAIGCAMTADPPGEVPSFAGAATAGSSPVASTPRDAAPPELPPPPRVATPSDTAAAAEIQSTPVAVDRLADEESANGTSNDTSAAAIEHEASFTATPAPRPMATDLPTSAFGSVTAIGDSVMLGAAAQLTAATGAVVDAEVSRQLPAVLALLRSYRDAGQLGRAVVLHVGHNGPISGQQFDDAMAIVGEGRLVVWVTLSLPRRYEGPNNALLLEGAARYSNAVIVDWQARASGEDGLLWADRIHLRPEGAAVYASLIRGALAEQIGE